MGAGFLILTNSTLSKMLAIIHAFSIFIEKIEFTKLNLKIEDHEPLNGSWKVLGCSIEYHC